MDAHFHEHLPFLFPHTDARSWFAGDEKTAMRHDHAFRNSSLQVAYLLLVARAIGLDTGPVSGFVPAALEKAFFPDQPHVKPNLFAPLGHGSHATTSDRRHHPHIKI